MAIVAVCDINHDMVIIPAGTVVTKSMIPDKDAVAALVEAGALVNQSAVKAEETPAEETPAEENAPEA